MTDWPRIGVLGGMGPKAGAHFLDRLIALTPATRDQDHLPVVLYSYPQIPDRSRAILGEGESPLSALKSGIGLLQDAGVSFVCIPCNTAHYYYDEIREFARIPVLNMIAAVAESVRDELPGIDKIGLLATQGTVHSGLYQAEFRKHGVEVCHPDRRDSDELHRSIERIKGAEKPVAEIEHVAEVLVDAGAQGIILGCTELSLVRADLSPAVPIFDSTEILARKAVATALEARAGDG